MGTPGTRNRCISALVTSFSSVTSAFSVTNSPACSTTAGSRNVVRSISRHGRHHVASKSISTGRPSARASASASSEKGCHAIGGAGGSTKTPAQADGDRPDAGEARERTQRAARRGPHQPEPDAAADEERRPGDRQPRGRQERRGEVERQAEEQEAEQALHPAEPRAAAREAAQPARRQRERHVGRAEPDAEGEEEREPERRRTAARRRTAGARRRSARCTARRRSPIVRPMKSAPSAPSPARPANCITPDGMRTC